jgi:hypothetical protein
MEILILQLLGLSAFLVGTGGLIIYLSRQRADFKRSLNFIFLQVLIPKKESKEDMDREREQTSEIRRVIGVAEHWFQTLYGIYSGEFKNKFTREDFLSCEYIATDGEIKFYIGCPRQLKSLIEKQITSFYPDAVIEETESPEIFKEKTHQSVAYLAGGKKFFYPLKTYQKFESSDPMNNILNSLSNASDENGNAAAVQFLIRPIKNDWQTKARKFSRELSEGSSGGMVWWNPFALLAGFVKIMVKGAQDKSEEDKTIKNDGASQEAVKGIEEKAEKVGFETIVRLVTSSPNKTQADVNLGSLGNAFAQYSSPSLNGLSSQKWYSKRQLIRNFLFRSSVREIFDWKSQRLVLTPEELSSLFHFPHIRFNDIPGVKWQNYKIAKAPNDVAKKGLLIGHNVYRGTETPIYMHREDRFRHFYVIGQTGTGKSSIFQTMIRQDLRNGDGLCVIDPHGSLVESILPYIPKNRVDDVILFEPADLERPMGLNLLEAATPDEQEMVALDAMNLMIKLFNEETFGPRIQDYFRNGCLTLMSDPAGGCLTDMLRLFTDNAFQKLKVQHVKNPVVKAFWTKQMASTGQKEQQEMIPYFAAKFGQFSTNRMMRNIIGQTKSAFDFSKVMNEKKILLMNLSKGMTGEINSKLLGLMIVSKIQVAALRRQKELTDGGQPVDFFLYIDEFQNYVTDSIESILSEARKYRLSLNIAHQYVGQIDSSGKQGSDTNLKDAVFGNVGTMMCYKIGAQDAEYMAKEMSPVFSDQDLINIDAFKAAIKLAINGKPSRPFSLNVVKPWLEKGDAEVATAVKQISRLTYGRAVKYVEKEIFTRLDV